MTERYQEYGGGVHDRWYGIIDNPCPRCKADVGEKCRNPITGHAAHLPCILRARVVSA